MAGQPKKFKKKEFEDLVFEYFDTIYNMQKQKEDEVEIPTFFGFYNYIKEIKPCSYHTVRRCFDEYWADIKKDFEQIRSDLLIRGGVLGKYNTAMTIFALKNWCRWKDNPDESDKQESKLEIKLIRE